MWQEERGFEKFVLETLRDIIKHDKVNLAFQIEMMQNIVNESKNIKSIEADDIDDTDDLSDPEMGRKERRERITIDHLQRVRETYEQRLKDIEHMLSGLDLVGVEQ